MLYYRYYYKICSVAHSSRNRLGVVMSSAIATALTEVLKGRYGTYVGFSPTDESAVGLGEY